MSIYENSELFWLALTAIMTALFAIPYVGQLIFELGPRQAATEQGDAVHSAKWGARAKRAHYNAVENLVAFAPLAIIVHLLNLTNDATALAAQIYFYSRLAHYLIYSFGIPYARTIAFMIAWLCQIYLGLVIFGIA